MTGRTTVVQDPTGDRPWPEEAAAKDVLHLDDATLPGALATHPKLLVFFYAAWCGHCKHFKPVYQDLATELQSEGSGGLLAAIDASSPDGRASAAQYNVEAYPTIIYFEYGKRGVGWETCWRSERDNTPTRVFVHFGKLETARW